MPNMTMNATISAAGTEFIIVIAIYNVGLEGLEPPT